MISSWKHEVSNYQVGEMIEGKSFNKICLEISSCQTILNLSNEDDLSVTKIISQQNHRYKKIRTLDDRGFELFQRKTMIFKQSSYIFMFIHSIIDSNKQKEQKIISAHTSGR
jgi:hypothetical protein